MIQIGYKSEKTQWSHNLLRWPSSPFFFDVAVFLLSILVTSPSLISISLTGSRVMTIFVYKGLTRNPEIGNTRIWVFPYIWRLERVKNTKFGTNVPNKMILNTAKYQVNSFYRFGVINGNQERGGWLNYPPSRLGLKLLSWDFHLTLGSYSYHISE